MYIDDDPLIFYHFHDLKRISTSFYLTGLNDFSMRLNKAISKHVYIPYIKQINGFGIAMPIRDIRIEKTASAIKYAIQHRWGYKFLRSLKWYVKGEGLFVKS